ncbi:hypothetical protein JYU34_004613, partial [Plutella xylostella]
ERGVGGIRASGAVGLSRERSSDSTLPHCAHALYQRNAELILCEPHTSAEGSLLQSGVAALWRYHRRRGLCSQRFREPPSHDTNLTPTKMIILMLRTDKPTSYRRILNDRHANS